MTTSYGASVYVSYARKDEEQYGAVAKLYEAFEDQWVCLKVDADVVKPRESFKDFIEEIGKADCIVVMFSEAYFKSFYCMLELTRIMETGNAGTRILPIFIDSSFRLDNKQRQLKAHWEQRVSQWREPYDATECAEEYGSEQECQAIVDQCDAIFSEFAFDQAYHVEKLVEESFSSIIKASKILYFNKCKDNPVFKQATSYFTKCSDEVKLVLRSQLDEQDITLTNDNVISYLVQNRLHSLLDIIAKSQASISSPESKKALGELLKHLLPLMIDPSYVEDFKTERGLAKIIAVPYAKKLSAEILMASADHRALNVEVRTRSDRTRALETIPGAYHLNVPPEGGDGDEQNQVYNMEQDLLNQRGDQGSFRVDLFEVSLFEDFASYERPADSYTQKRRQRKINKGLEREAYHYYWIMPFNADQSWQAFANEVQRRYPKIIILELDTDEDKEDNEDDLLYPLPQLISY